MTAKKVLAFDLDGTLALSKSPLSPEMGNILDQLLAHFQICVISGGKFEQFETQLLSGLRANEEHLSQLHLMPTCGTQYYRYRDGWKRIYAENFSEDEKKKIINALERVVDQLGFRETIVYGDVIEDRGSQVTFSALGQNVVETLGEKGVRLKEEWDADGTKKERLRSILASQLPEFEVRAGGSTSIDITKPGIDKAYGMRKIMELLNVEVGDILFFGDKLQEGGNDYPVKTTGIEAVAVTDWHDTYSKLMTILKDVN